MPAARLTGFRRSCAIVLLAWGCAGPGPTPAPSVADSPTASPVITPEPTPERTPEPAVPRSPALGRDHRSVVACRTDADCGWDDPCRPRRCVEAGIEATCKDSAPAPGACLCLAGACTTRPSSPPSPSGACELGACMVDRAAGTCVVDDGGAPEGLRPRPGVDVGPSCDCVDPAKGCAFTWFDPVPCATDRDCWVSSTPRRHPIARPKALRKRDFKPCSDGEVAPKCGAEGHCVLGPAAGC